jgi:c-di-GMP-binding flagellar brake protein YcgR
MSLPVALVVITAGLTVFLLFSLNYKKGPGWIKFLAKGKDEGFSIKEIELLHQLAIKSKLEEPTALFFSQDRLDECIKSLVKTMRLSGTENDKEGHDFLSKLYDYRKKIEMEKPRNKHGIANSRQISEGQHLRVMLKNTGIFQAHIITNTSQYMAISRPTSEKHVLPESFSWQGQSLSIYFWRSEDAGYTFNSVVQDEMFSKGLACLKISHAESLNRTQKRKSIRVRVQKPAYLYPIIHEDDAGKPEKVSGIKCVLEDLSDTGCAVSVGGKASANMRLKIQFVLNNSVVCMSGTVRSFKYYEDQHKSLVRIESDPLPIEMRNHIMGEIFGMLPEGDDDLPFNMLGEESDELSEIEPTGETAGKIVLNLVDGSRDDGNSPNAAA